MAPARASSELAAPATPHPRSHPVVALALVLEYCVPGAGYLILGKLGRALVAFLGIAFMVGWGLFLDGQLDRPEAHQLLSLLASFASMGIGLAYFLVTGSDHLRPRARRHHLGEPRIRHHLPACRRAHFLPSGARRLRHRRGAQVKTHFLNLVLYALCIGVLFSLFMRDGTRERMRFALMLWVSMVGIAIAVGWIMYFID